MSIQKISSKDRLSRSADLVQNNVDRLKSIFPEIVTEGKIDFKVLLQVLGEEIEEEEEYYRFTWAGKSRARQEAHKPSTGTLRPEKNESLDWNTTKNLYIEGDNLEVLKLLQKSYTRKIKMIYIDPPYNTGKDFVYKDNYKDNLKNYQEITGQIDIEGNRASTNSDSDGRYHSNWLNMMYPRLLLARKLLKDDGIIFISIDDNEVENLLKLGKEIFGEVNYLNTFIWINNSAGRQIQGTGGATTKEYILCFSKSIAKVDQFFIENKLAKKLMPDIYKGFDFDIKEDNIGQYITTHELYNGNSNFNEKTRPNLVFDIFYSPSEDNVQTGDVGSSLPRGYQRISPKRILNGQNNFYAWRWSREKIIKEKVNLEFAMVKGRWAVFSKRRDFANTIFKDTITNISTVQGTNDILKLGIENHFDYPKPVNLIKLLIKIFLDKNSIILDFFSGSSTTASAIMEANLEDNGSRVHIQVQLPEHLNLKTSLSSGMETITDLAKNRMCNVVANIKNENPKESKNLDLGFKVFKLDSSNIKSWDGDPEYLRENLLSATENIKEDRNQEDILYEILLKYGLDLTLPIEERSIDGKRVYNVGLGALFLCLADVITTKVAEGIGKWKVESDPETCRVVFKDTGFSSAKKDDRDEIKTNSVQILKGFGIKEIRSI